MIISVCLQVVDREVFMAGFDLNEDSKTSGVDVFNGSMDSNLTAPQHTVELMGLQCGKECYAITIAAAVTFLAGIYQVKKQWCCIFTVPKFMFSLASLSIL